MKLHVHDVHKMKNSGMVIGTKIKQDAGKLKQAVQHSMCGLPADESAKRKSHIFVVGVLTSLRENVFFRCLFEQNTGDKFPLLIFESFLTFVNLIHKSGSRNAAPCNYVIEVPTNIRKGLMAQCCHLSTHPGSFCPF